MNNPIKSLTRREWCLWLASLAVVLIANQITPELDPLTMTAALVGVTSLVFAAKGNVWSQVLMIVFSILYGVISFRFHYWGEMITYLGMTLPMAVWSTVTWLKNPSKENGSEVAIQTPRGAGRQHRRRCGGVLLHLKTARYAESLFQHRVDHHELSRRSADDAALVLLCRGLRGE